MRYSTIAFATIAGAHSVVAWGALGHQTVASVAQNFLTPQTKAWVSNVLGDTMANVSTWADSYRYTADGKWSAALHYIDAEDSPPHVCGVELSRDCGPAGCIVSAIANFTSQVLDKDTTHEELGIALKFLIHFFGDVTQPLHCENANVGGNTIAVTFDGYSTNLHAAWDTSMPQKIAGMNISSNTLDYAKKWSTVLTDEINSGIYECDVEDWIKCSTIQTAEDCALAWATDANAFVCTDVLAGGIPSLTNAELDNSYFTKAAPVISEQLAKGGYRLADWLNKLYVAVNQQ